LILYNATEFPVAVAAAAEGTLPAISGSTDGKNP
jgi:hypothetical protein